MASRNSSAAGGQEYERILDRVAGAVRGVLGSGRVPDQIPVLASADPQTFGLAVATVDGEVHGVGEWRRRFSIQSISKVFTLALVIENDGVSSPVTACAVTARGWCREATPSASTRSC